MSARSHRFALQASSPSDNPGGIKMGKKKQFLQILLEIILVRKIFPWDHVVVQWAERICNYA